MKLHLCAEKAHIVVDGIKYAFVNKKFPLKLPLTLCSLNILIVYFFQGDQANFEILSQSFHYSQVTGLDVCTRKPLIATCSLDRSLRIWNYETWYVSVLYIYRIVTNYGPSLIVAPLPLYAHKSLN